MRISTKQIDPGYSDDAMLHTVELDGVVIKGFFIADEEKGVVHYYDLVNGQIFEKVAYGKVKIFKPGE
ncbi:MAG: hypothetical protein PVG39_02490 [Desulfobacteraceae bacterium]|jgi:hypothetical protein